MANDNKTLELQIRIAAQEATRTITLLKGEIQTLATEAQKFAGKDGAALNKTFKDAEAAAKDTVSGIGGIKRAILNLAEVAVAAKTLSVIKDMGAFALQTADNFQTMRNQFGVLLGDMEAGAGLFNEIKAFNDKTPFDLSTLTQATNVLISAKVPLQDLQAQLTKFGDLSQGNSQRLTSYVNAFSQAAAKGKADMQVLNTYLHQGVPILDALAKNFNTTTAEIVKMSSDGQISFDDFSRALDDLTAAGGQYFGGMELASKSLAAMQEGLKEATNSLAASFGEMLLPSAVGIVGIFTDITNAINESPILKGLLAGAIIAVTGYMTAMAAKAVVLAAKTWLAQAAQMGLNASLAVTNPLLLAGIAAATTATVAYVAYAAQQQKATRASEDFALAQKKANDATREGSNAVHDYYKAAQEFEFAAALNEVRRLQAAVDEIRREQGNTAAMYSDEAKNLKSATDRFIELRNKFIKEFYDATTDEKITELRDRIGVAQTYLVTVDISPKDKNKLEEIIDQAGKEIDKLLGDAAEKAAKWQEDWAGVWNKFQAEQAHDPFYEIELERKKKLEDAWNNYVRDGNKEVIDQVNDYYDAQRGEIIKRLGDEEDRIRRELSKSKIDDLQYEFDEAIKAINKLEAQRVIAAAGSEEEIARIRQEYEDMREVTTLEFNIEIDKTKLDEARESLRDWQQELSDKIALALMDIEGFSSQAAVLIGDMTAQFAAISLDGMLNGLNAVGKAFATGGDAAENFRQAMADMAQQMLQQLPMMFLQAGLQLISQGQWLLGLGFIAAAGSTAIISGYVDGTVEKAQKEASGYAQGGVFDEYGKAARAFADGGTFTNQIVSAPTLFRHGDGLGLMGEAGPEAIMPLTRMPNGDLGVQTAGGGANVTVIVNNYSGAEVRQEESEDGMGNKQLEITIGDRLGEMVNRHIASGKADRAMARYGTRPMGV
jgi:tape measure domain-containing protein